ncbi:hypothetical protein AZG88_39225 [Rhodococcus sp. LB1]|nr:hypothetical protein AZG88_39225 [Rhodococcus sp. LB1]
MPEVSRTPTPPRDGYTVAADGGICCGWGYQRWTTVGFGSSLPRIAIGVAGVISKRTVEFLADETDESTVAVAVEDAPDCFLEAVRGGRIGERITNPVVDRFVTHHPSPAGLVSWCSQE